jgi:hypothetical protein
MHYQTKYLKHSDGAGCASNSYIKTDYGYLIRKMTNFIGIYTTKLFIYPDGFAKAVTKAKVNYTPNEQWTIYFDAQGHEITTEGNSTRKELAIWKKLRLNQ